LHPMDRAVAKLCILSRLLVVAALLATNMNVRGDDARMGKCPPENLFERCMPGKHGAIRVGKNEIRWRGVNGGFEIRDELASDGDRISVAALRRVVIVRTRDGDEPSREIDVRLAQAKQLALPKAGIDRRRKKRLPPLRHRPQNERHLVQPQKLWLTLRHAAPPDLLGRIRTLPPASAFSAVESRE